MEKFANLHLSGIDNQKGRWGKFHERGVRKQPVSKGEIGRHTRRADEVALTEKVKWRETYEDKGGGGKKGRGLSDGLGGESSQRDNNSVNRKTEEEAEDIRHRINRSEGELHQRKKRKKGKGSAKSTIKLLDEYSCRKESETSKVPNSERRVRGKGE